MTTRLKLTAAICLALSCAPLASAAPFYQNGRLSYDNQCITIDGKDLVIYSGAFHYFRCPKELWAERFKKLKEAGFNAVETYTAWNYHEQQMPDNPDDFSKMDTSEIHDWLEMATDQFGFQVILRPGPYICAEWDGGGYPQWLLNKRPADYKPREWFRSGDTTYLAWCKHWYTAVAKVAAPFQVTKRPAGKAGIILWQIENEYDYSDQPVAVKKAQLIALAHLSRDLGIDVPLMTCQTNNKAFHDDPYLSHEVVQTNNTYPAYNVPGMSRDISIGKEQPEKFKMVTELQGGWFAQVGGKLSEAQGFNETHLIHVTLLAWEQGFTSTNYYMGFGGTNFGDWGAQTLTTTYDYDAPVRESGGVTARYFAAKAMGEFIAEHGPALARSVVENVTTKSDDKAVHVTVRKAVDGSRFIFARVDDRGKDRKGTLSVLPGDGTTITADYDLGSFGAKIYFIPANATTGTWYPKPAEEIKRPTDLPKPITPTIKQMADTGPTQWMPFDPAMTETQEGIFNRQYVFYRSTINAPADNTNALSLSAHVEGKDWAAVSVDGGEPISLKNNRIPLGVTTGSHQLLAMYDNGGRPNFGSGLEQPSGLLKPRVVASPASRKEITGWTERPLARGEKYKSLDANDPAWKQVQLPKEDGDLKPDTAAAYRAILNVSEDDLKTGGLLTLGRVDDDGTIYINGQKAGESHDWATPVELDITKFLHAGANEVIVHVVNKENTGGLSKGTYFSSIGASIPNQWEMSQASAGVAGKWWDTAFDDSAWKAASADEKPALLTWYRMHFELPAPTADKWFPWRLNLTTTGDGFLYLNGHPLGRYWQQGPQHDFYLPECWLNFGPGKTNVITLQMRPTDGPVTIKTAEVRPYENLAEMR